MFCGKCGTENPDGTAFCSECGAPLDPPAAPAAAPAAPGSGKHKMVGVAAVAVVAVLALVLLISLFSGRSAKSAAKKFTEAVFDADGGDIIELIPKGMLKSSAEDRGMKLGDYKDMLEESYEDQFEQLSDMLDDVKVTVKVDGQDEYSSQELRDIKDRYSSRDVKVKDAGVVLVKLTLKAHGEKVTLQSPVRVPVIKVGGSWYVDVDYLGTNFSISLINAITSSIWDLM